jgi:hypothetical protein
MVRMRWPVVDCRLAPAFHCRKNSVAGAEAMNFLHRSVAGYQVHRAKQKDR